MERGVSIEIFGASLEAALLATLMADQGEKTTWYINTPSWSARPQKLHHNTYRQIVNWLSSKARRVDFLITAPEIEAWKIGDSSYAYDFPFLSTNLSRWVDTQSIYNELKSLAKEMGVRMVESERFPKPDWSDSKFRILACSKEPLVDWPKGLFDQNQKLNHVEVCEINFPTDPLNPRCGRIYHLNGALGFLEPRCSDQTFLSLYSTSGDKVSRAIRALQNPLSSSPNYLKALFMQNMSAKRRFLTQGYGRSPINSPGIAMLGSAIGSLNPATGLNTNLHLKEAFQLADYIKQNQDQLEQSFHSVAEKWNVAAEQRFKKAFKSSNLWLKGIQKTSLCRQTLAAGTLLPQFLREALKSPL